MTTTQQKYSRCTHAVNNLVLYLTDFDFKYALLTVLTTKWLIDAVHLLIRQGFKTVFLLLQLHALFYFSVNKTVTGIMRDK